MVEDPLESGRGGDPGEVRSCVPFTGVISPSGRFLKIDGLGDPGTVFSCSVCDDAPWPGGIIGVILEWPGRACYGRVGLASQYKADAANGNEEKWACKCQQKKWASKF